MEDVEVCKNCGGAAEAGGYSLPLCPRCRDLLAKRPLPKWIKVATAIVCVLFIYALFQFPDSLQAGIAFQRGLDAEHIGQFATAAEDYKIVVDHYPQSTLAIARLGIAEYHDGDVYDALIEFNKIAGREASTELTAEVNQIIDEINAKSK